MIERLWDRKDFPALATLYGIDPALLEQPIKNFGLSTRASNCLRADCIIYVGHLVQHSRGSISRIPNMGEVSVKEIEDKILRG